MNAAAHDRAYGRRLARNGLRVTRSTHEMLGWDES